MEVTYSILRDKRPAPSPVNLGELAIVRTEHMPSHLVQWSSPCQLVRRAAEVSRQHPHLQEEADFVVADELARRIRLIDTPLTINS